MQENQNIVTVLVIVGIIISAGVLSQVVGIPSTVRQLSDEIAELTAMEENLIGAIEGLTVAEQDLAKAFAEGMEAVSEQILAIEERLASVEDALVTEPTDKVEQVLTIGITYEPLSLDPLVTQEEPGGWSVGLIYERLVGINWKKLSTTGEYSLEGSPWGVAKSWEISDDGLTYTFHLQEGVTFASGNDLDASAVKFSIDRGLEFVHEQYETVKGCNVIDSLTVEIHLNYPFAPFIQMIAEGAFSILDPELMDHEIEGDLGTRWLNDNSAGSGAWILDHWTHGSEIVLVKNNNYWNTPRINPNLDKIVLPLIPESTAHLMMIKSGQIDITVALTPEQWFELEGTLGVETILYKTQRLTYMSMCNTTEALQDVRVRRAVRYAIDYEGFIEFIGWGTVQQSPVPIGWPFHDTEYEYYYQRDLVKAKELLTEAEYPDGFSTTLTGISGLGPLYGLTFEDMAVLLGNDLAEVGIDVEIQMLPEATFWDLFVGGKLEGFVILGWGPPYPHPYATLSLFVNKYSPRLNINWPEMVDLVEVGRSETDLETAEDIWSEVQRLMVEDGYIIWLNQLPYNFAIRDDITGYFWDTYFGFYMDKISLGQGS